MAIYLSLLRGINLGSHHKIRMADLKKLYEKLNYTHVHTYIQSGNVLFESSDANHIASSIEKEIQKTYGFDVPVIVKTAVELKKAVASNPFLQEKNIDQDKLHLTFLEEAPRADVLQAIDPTLSRVDRLIVKKDIVYLYCPGGYGNTKWSNAFLEKKLKIKATTRNWKTCNELIKLIEAHY
jgi:uncharacterized protein (DUF1697 family)